MVKRLDSERKVAKKGIQARFQARLFLLGIKANGQYLRQVAFTRGKLPSRAAAALAW